MVIKTLGDLKDFLNTLNFEQLSQSAIISQEDSFVRIGDADVSTETYYYNEDSEGLIPVADYDPEYYDGIPLSDDTYNTIVPPGHVFIHEDMYFSEEERPDPTETLEQICDRLAKKFGRPIDYKRFAREVASEHFFSQMERLKVKS